MDTKKINKRKKSTTSVPAASKEHKKEVSRILKQNLDPVELEIKTKKKHMKESIVKTIAEKENLTEADLPFLRSFIHNLLKEEDEAAIDSEVDPNVPKAPDEFTPEKTKQDYENSLDSETGKEDFDVEGLDPNISTESIKQIKEWSSKLGKFAEFLNDPSTKSLHKVLADNDKNGSLLKGITRKASDSITRIAGEVEKLKEVLNSFIIMAPKKLRDQENIV